MGTRGKIGFVQKGVRKGVYNHFDSYPSGLGDDIIKFILNHTDTELAEMVSKVEQLEWIREDQTERLDDHTFRLLHFPPLPPLFGDYYSDEPPEASLSAFKLKNPDFPSSISDEEILQRYISNRLPNSIVWEVNVLSWIPETGEVIQTTHQHDLFQRIWDGRQRYSIEEPPDEEFQYWIDFENQTLEAEGYLDWEYHSVIRLPFNDLKVGILEETAKRNAEDRTRARERRQAEEQLDARVNSVKSSGA